MYIVSNWKKNCKIILASLNCLSAVITLLFLATDMKLNSRISVEYFLI